MQICNENVCWLITNPDRALTCNTPRDQTDLSLFVYLLRTTLTFIRLNWRLEANCMIALLAIIASNQIITFPACFPYLHPRTRISCQCEDSDSWTSDIQHPESVDSVTCWWLAEVILSHKGSNLLHNAMDWIHRTISSCTDLLLTNLLLLFSYHVTYNNLKLVLHSYFSGLGSLLSWRFHKPMQARLWGGETIQEWLSLVGFVGFFSHDTSCSAAFMSIYSPI